MRNFKYFALLIIFLHSVAAYAQTFTQGNIAVLVVAASASNTTGSIVELNPVSALQVPANTFPIGGTGANAIRFSGSATSTGYLANTNDGSLLTFMGANSTNTTSNVNTLNPRAVSTLDYNYTFNIATTYTGGSGNQTRSATSINNTNWYIADQGGLYTNGTSVASPVANLRGIKSFGGTVYAMQSSSTPAVIAVNTVSATSGGTITGLPGITNDASAQDFYLISSGSNGSTYDILYTISATSNTAGTIRKFSLVSGTWTANGSYTTTFGGFGLAATQQGSGAYLFVSSGQGALTANSLIRLTDVAGYNTTINITTGNNVTLYTTGTGTIIKGVAFAPINTCTAPIITSASSNSPICAGNSLNFTLSTSGSSPLTYTWSGPNGFTSALQNPALTNATSNATGSYTVIVNNICGADTEVVNVTVHSLPSAVITPAGPTTFCFGDSVILSSSTALSYSWSNGDTLPSTTIYQSGNYSVIVTDSNNCSATSNPVSVTVNSNVTPSISISANPGNVICNGTEVTFNSSIQNGGSIPSYQWYLNGVAVGTDSASYSNGNLSEDDVVYSLLVSNANCQTIDSTYSDSIVIHVNTSVIPTITINASVDTTCSGTPVTFTATTQFGGLTPQYNWYINGMIQGSDSSEFVTDSLTSTDSVTCVLLSSDACASPATATSNTKLIHVISVSNPSVTITANPDSVLCGNTAITFTANATNAGTPTYQWYKNNILSGTDSVINIDSTLQNNDTIYCKVTSSLTCSSPLFAQSLNYIVQINNLPNLTINGPSAVCPGDTIILTADTGLVSYLWSTGSVSNSISVIAGGNYTVTVSDGYCSATATRFIVADTLPSQPDSFVVAQTSVYYGQSGIVFTVASDSGVTYQWTYSGTGLQFSGTSNTITISVDTNATSGILSVVAVNNCSVSTALTKSINVVAAPGIMRITEYMYNGSGVGGAGEFVEFTNVGTSTVDMTGWSFDDNGRIPGSQNLSSFGIVQPGESVILTEINAGTYRTNWNLCNGVKVIGGSTNNLGREDEINLYDATGTLVDRITYGDQTFAPGTIRTTTKSGWVNSAGLGANTIAQWTLSATADSEASYASTLGEIGSPGKSSRAIVAYDPCFIANGAPAILIDVAATTNFIDGATLVSPVSPYGVSGVINDATDPSKLYGIDFTINDDVTLVDSLIVTVSSSNQNVVPDSALILSGTGSSRNLKIIPTGVGYSILTVTVNDGTSTSNYIINFAASDPSPNIIPANTFWHTGMSDASNGIPLDNNYYLTGDDELNVLNVYSRNESGLPLKSFNYTSFLSLPEPSSPEVDVEGATRSTSIAGRMYWTGSMSNGKLPFDDKPNRERLFATQVSGTGDSTSISFVGYYNIKNALFAWGDSLGYAFTTSASAGVDPKAFNGFSLEGMVFGPDSTTMYLGLRAPLVPTGFRTKAVIAPILNFESWFNNGNPTISPVFGAPIELDLDLRGIRDIIRLTNGTYLIVAGSPADDAGVNNLYKWSGYSGDEPILINNIAGNLLNIEGLMQVNDSTGQPSLTQLQIVTDGGAQILYQDNSQAKDFADLNLRKFRSDVLTGLDLDICSEFTAMISPSGDTAICSGNTVNLNASSTSQSQLIYHWSNDSVSPSIAASIGSYIVTISNRAGCTATSATVNIINALPSDFNNDQVTNNIDFLLLLGKFNQSCTGCREDINHDNIVNNVDFLILLGQFNRVCQ